jgi:hypothetical protein
MVLIPSRSRVPQSIQCLATDWTTGRSRFDPRQRQEEVSSNQCIQTGSGSNPISCTMGTGVLSPVAKREEVLTLATHSYLVLML